MAKPKMKDELDELVDKTASLIIAVNDMFKGHNITICKVALQALTVQCELQIKQENGLKIPDTAILMFTYLATEKVNQKFHHEKSTEGAVPLDDFMKVMKNETIK